jgi:hypothetical protein
LSSSQVLTWQKAFKDEEEGVEDKQHARRPSSSRTENSVARMKAGLDRDRRLSVRLMAEEVGLPKMDVHRIITEDLYMRKIADTWILHHDNAPSHTSITVREFLAQNKITTLPHPPYSPDLAPCDFFLFPKLNTHLKGDHFGAVENIQAAATRALNSISIEDFQHC